MRNAIVLAAGLGTKIWPYGEFRQKCTLPVANLPIIRHIIKNLVEVGCDRIAVVIGHHGQQIRGAIGDFKEASFLIQSSLDGTAAATINASQLFDSDSFLVVYGDTVSAVENLRILVGQFHQSGVEAASLVQPLLNEDASNWICAQISGDKLTGIEGHPRGGSHRLCGIYAFKPSALEYILRNPGIVSRVPVGGMPSVEAELAQSLQMIIEDGKEILAVQTAEFFVDVDKPWHILEANAKMINYLTSRLDKDIVGKGSKISEAAEINGHVVLGENSVIGPRVVLRGNLIAGKSNNITNGAILHGNFVIGDQCRISDYCDVGGNSAIGNRCIIGHGAEMSGVLMDKVYLYHYCEMSGIFGCATDVGAATVCGTLRFDDQGTVHNIKGKREIPHIGANATYMGDYCRTGVNAIIMPGCKIGSYSVVGPGVILYEDLPSKTMILAKQELIKKPWGPERYGW